MKRTAIVLALAVVFLLGMSTNAFADHSPTFYVEWNQTTQFDGYNGTTFGNQGSGSPHQGYLEGTEKCGVCHSVHRAPIPGMKWDTDPLNDAARTPVAGGQYNRQEWVSGSATTQMLLIDDVANSCNFCHVDTSIGNKQLYAGSRNYINSTDAYGTDEWDEGFGHHNGCTGCHAVHGVSSNFGDAANYGQYGTFRGPVVTKVLKVRAKGTATVWQDEVIVAGSAGQIEAAGLFGSFWTDMLAVDDAAVDPMNVPLFPSATDAIMGTNVRADANVWDAQVSAFCTFCHQNYGYASEAVVNPDGDRSLFQGPWYTDGSNVGGTPGTWYAMGSAPGQNAPFKNHPLRNATNAFAAAGKTAAVPTRVAFVNSSTCRSCHDAGLDGLDDVDGCIVQSWPHFTPGYFHFTKSAAHVGAPMTYAPPIPDVLAAGNLVGITNVHIWLDDPTNYDKALTVADGQCLKCHVNAANDAGVGKTY